MAAPAPGLTLRGDPATFSAALRGLLNSPRFSDVTFLVGKERQEVFAHRCLLASRCEFFGGLLEQKPPAPAGRGPPRGEPVVLDQVRPEVFLAVLEFLYTNSVPLNSHTALEVLTSAVEYGLKELRELCVDFVAESLDVELVCDALQVAVTFGLPVLQERCVGFIENHTQDVLGTRAFHELSAPALLPVLHSDRLDVDEAELIAATGRWAHVSSAVLERPVGEVARPAVGELRLALLSPRELSSLEEKNQKDQLIPVEQIAEAWKCHALRKGPAAQGPQCRRRRGTRPREHHRFFDSPPK
ncbi:BTB/POZ domain-containing protein 19 [Tachyglossus aculeatus]|uniref:BTB/POZ domain-containing protein 19 n=1 Tax=Tachyglossus aculeatus TaxID=9261 RepID=UPI0018F305E8|nr:BTB/POZ domain-containing protein 19 [Tachyglossus aculeatus]